MGEGRPRPVRHQPRPQPRQLHVAFRDARGRETGSAARQPGIALSTPTGVRARLRPLTPRRAARAGAAHPGDVAHSRQRQPSPRADRALLDPTVGAALRRPRGPGRRPDGPQALLDHGGAGGRSGGRDGPVGGGAGAGVHHSAPGSISPISRRLSGLRRRRPVSSRRHGAGGTSRICYSPHRARCPRTSTWMNGPCARFAG